jgi:hypothetical protein
MLGIDFCFGQFALVGGDFKEFASTASVEEGASFSSFLTRHCVGTNRLIQLEEHHYIRAQQDLS